MILLIYGLSLIICVLGVPTSSCPRFCTCAFRKSTSEFNCTTFDFLQNDGFEKSSIVKLTITDANLSQIDSNLLKLDKLIDLSLLKGQITSFAASQLPSTLQYLDVSYNQISHIAQDLDLLPSLKIIRLSGNPISCSCDSLLSRDSLLKSGLKIVGDIRCANPSYLKGKPYLTVDCDQLFGEMQNDAAPYEGSGSEEDHNSNNDETTDMATTLKMNAIVDADDATTIEEEFMKQPMVELTRKKVIVDDDDVDEEGSGDSEYDLRNHNNQSQGLEEPEHEHEHEQDSSLSERTYIKPCNFNCSTPAPLDASNDTHTFPTPGFFEGIGIIVSDLDIISDKATTTTQATIPTTATSVTTQSMLEQNNNTDGYSVDSKESNLIGNHTTSSIIEADQQINPTFVFLSILVLLMVCFIVYAIIKRRSTRRRPYERDDGVEEEMIPIKIKPDVERPNGIRECEPLLNGHDELKGKIVESSDHDLAIRNGKDDDKNQPSAPPPTVVVVNGSSNSLEKLNGDLEKKQNEEATRVTIKAAELPDSIPKTPVLVNRRINSDGSVTTTFNEE